MTLSIRTMVTGSTFLNQQFRCLSTKGDKSCRLILYRSDNGECSEQVNVATESFSKETAKKVNDFIASYFDVTEESDRLLLKSLFTDIQLNWFELTKLKNPETVLGIKLIGNRKVVFDPKPEKLYVPKKIPLRLSVREESVFGKTSFELGYEELKKSEMNDFSLIALFNSESFKSLSACSTNLGLARFIKKIDT